VSIVSFEVRLAIALKTTQITGKAEADPTVLDYKIVVTVDSARLIP